MESLEEYKKIGDVQRIICGDCLDFKVRIRIPFSTNGNKKTFFDISTVSVICEYLVKKFMKCITIFALNFDTQKMENE